MGSENPKGMFIKEDLSFTDREIAPIRFNVSKAFN